MKAVLHGVGDMTPKPLPARIKGWQRHGGLVEMTSVEIRGASADANAQGTITLSEHGGIEGLLELCGADYDRLLEALTGMNPATRMSDQATPGAAERAREFATRRLPGGNIESKPPRSGAPASTLEEKNAASGGRMLPALRFEDGTVYFGSTPLGRLPALF